MQAPKKPLLSLEQALRLSRHQVRDAYREHMNPGLASLLGLLDSDRQYVRAEGVYVWDSEGNRYLDFLGGFGSLNLGHNHPRVLEALEKVRTLPNLLQASMGTMAAALAHNLSALAPGDLKHAFFGNSGAESVEGALKLARAATGRTPIVFCHGSFHGKSLGALSVTGRDKYRKPFMPLLPNCLAVPFGHLPSLEQAFQSARPAAFIFEPIQGEGGVVVPPPGYLRGVRELCTRYGVLMIADEIQTGLGRTGYLFAVEHEQVAPDVMCLAKSLGGGIMPIGAFLTTSRIWNQAYGGLDRCLLHTSTFGGNTWAAAAGIAALEVLQHENLPQAAREKGGYMLQRLQTLQEKFPLIKEVRGRGLLIGIEFERPAKGWLDKISAGAVNRLSEEYLGAMVAGELQNRYRIITAYTLNNPNVIRLEPPLNVTREQIDQVVDALEDIFSHKGLLGLTLSTSRTALGSLLKK